MVKGVAFSVAALLNTRGTILSGPGAAGAPRILAASLTWVWRWPLVDTAREHVAAHNFAQGYNHGDKGLLHYVIVAAKKLLYIHYAGGMENIPAIRENIVEHQEQRLDRIPIAPVRKRASDR